jgi:oligopeptide/dipeptide ABC transporter ATP-binding protein
VIADLADEVVVMYAGRVVEQGSAEQIFYGAEHPYTQGLLRAAPVLGRGLQKRLYSIPGTVPSLRAAIAGCAFRPRCPERFARCIDQPDLAAVGEEHRVRCWARQPSVNGDVHGSPVEARR